DRKTVLTGDAYESAEIIQGSELRVHRLVAALIGSDRPWASRLVGLCPHAVVGAFPMGAANGVDGRKVEHVESHARDVGQPFLDVAKRSVLALLAGGPREHLVPRAVTRPLRLNDDLDLTAVGRGKAAVGVPFHELCEV